MKRQTSLTLNPALVEKATALAKKDGRSLSNQVERWMEEKLSIPTLKKSKPAK